MKVIVALLAALVVAHGACAQTARMARVGILHNGTVATNGHLTEAFVKGLADHGFVDGRNLALELRHAEGQFARLPALAQELRDVDVIFAPSALAAGAARRSGVSAPIVFALAPDPIGEGFVATLARPGGHMTGLTTQSPELGAKRVDLLREALPRLTRLGVLYAEPFPGVAAELDDIHRAAATLGKELRRVEVKRPDDLVTAFRELVEARIDALLVVENPMFFANRATIVALARQHRLPAIYRAKEYTLSGGLMSYGADYADLCRRAAAHVARILRGAKPGELPVEQPVKFELVVNRSAAQAIGLTLPHSLLLRADQSIE